jgi:aerobic-type carbon monoxide dehydrogenase small subunit (CoxS/CutS family)
MKNVLSTIHLRVDGRPEKITTDDPSMPLLYALRDDLGHANPRFGCGLAQCGACTVQVDGVAMRSCVLPIAALEGKSVTTLAGLGTPEHPHPVQAAFVEEQAMQCGYCVNGWIMTGAALVDKEKHPSAERIKSACASLVCRCGSQLAMMRAIGRAAGEKA